MCLVTGMQMLRYISSSLFYKIENIEYDDTPPTVIGTLHIRKEVEVLKIPLVGMT